jgi:hypothetical protein
MNNLAPFTNTKLKKIVNVYQLNCVNGKTQGFGDYLRGCIFLRQLAQLLNIEFDLDISNHPISKYIENSESNPEIDYSNIFIECCNKNLNFMNKNVGYLNEIINDLNRKDCEVCALFTNSFPIYNSYGIGCQFIKSRLRPNNIMKNYIDETLNTLGLTKNAYGVIHIRTGDNNLINNDIIKIKFLSKIRTILISKINPTKRYLILSDSNTLKQNLKDIPNFYVIIKNIAHLGGEGIKSTKNDSVKNTLLDFYLMEYSNIILSFTIYDHGSGFSKFCSVLNNIPYLAYKI